MNTWIRVADGVWQRRYQPVDVSVVAIEGPTGVVIVDTRNNGAEGAEIKADAAAVFEGPVVAAINTHAHYDHTFGNRAFSEVPIFGHHRVPAHFAAFEAPRLARVQADPTLEPDQRWADVELTPPTVLVRQETAIAPGGRRIVLLPLPPGHTDTDLAILVPDARVWLLGDVIEESGPPMFGSGSHPLEWPQVLDALLERIEPGDAIVPGHGTVVDREFVRRQADSLRAVAAAIRAAYDAGQSIDDAVGGHGLPWPDAFLRSAFADGFAQLGATA
ncbi:MBL fold metallo-hydrolase [Microbacteriaceae bacterium VKM Ac-2855]|nr:MBL fold metallo-hydrolase [Microbacteriaceae bacterium VKM Ac-2855]